MKRMDTLQNDIQVIVQYERMEGEYRCLGFNGIPTINPCLIVFAPPHSDRARKYQQELRNAFLRTLYSLPGYTKKAEVPCNGTICSPLKCHAHSVFACQKLLIIVGDHQTQLSFHNIFDDWLKKGFAENYKILPVFPKAAMSRISTLVPQQLHHINVAFWEHSIQEVIPTILATVGLSTDEFKIFISYKRDDTEELANELFDQLNRNNFDVFLDRFRVEPGVDFQERLTEELANKSMVVVLESEHILDSEWIRYEIDYTKLHRLGLIALHLPNGQTFNNIENEQRMELGNNDIIGQKKSRTFTNSNNILDRVVSRIKKEHQKSFMYRRLFSRMAMKDALLQNNITIHEITGTGFLVTKQGGKVYKIWLTPRPPATLDFHRTHVEYTPKNDIGIIIGPITSLLARNRLKIDWLSQVSHIQYFDEGEMLKVAEKIAQGTI